MAQEPETDKLDITDELIAERRSGAPGETPEDMHPLSRKIVGNIDIFSNWIAGHKFLTGQLWLNLPNENQLN